MHWTKGLGGMEICEGMRLLYMNVSLLKNLPSADPEGSWTRICKTPVVASGSSVDLGVQVGPL